MSQDPTTDNLFRAEALEARRRIDALPNTMRVTSGWARTTVVGIVAALAAALVASACIAVPVQVPGDGAIIDTSGELLGSVAASTAGFVDTILVRPGARVARGQAVARLRLPEQTANLARLKAVAEGLEGEARAFDALAERDRAKMAMVHRARIERLDIHIANLDRRGTWLRDQEAAERALVQKGIATATRLIAAQIAVQDAVIARDQAHYERASITAAALEADAQREKDSLARKLRVQQASLEIAEAERDLAARSVLTSSVDGVVADVLVRPGVPVASGQPLLVVMAEGRDTRSIEAVLFVPLAIGKRVAPGDGVLLTPASMKEGENDRLRATVRTVSPTAATRGALVASFGNEQLADLTLRGGPVFQVIVALQRDPAAPSGFAWTSGVGPALTLSRGTPLSASITVERIPLIALALPAIRGLFETRRSLWSGAAT